MNGKRVARLGVVVGLVISACSTAPSTSGGGRTGSAPLQAVVIQSLVRALMDTQRTVARSQWLLLENSAEQTFRHEKGMPDDASLSDEDRSAIRESAREKLGTLLEYVDAREKEPLALASNSCESTFADREDSSACDAAAALAMRVSDAVRRFDEQVLAQTGYVRSGYVR